MRGWQDTEPCGNGGHVCYSRKTRMDPKHVHKGAFLAEGLWMSLSSSKNAPVWTCVPLDEEDILYNICFSIYWLWIQLWQLSQALCRPQLCPSDSDLWYVFSRSPGMALSVSTIQILRTVAVGTSLTIDSRNSHAVVVWVNRMTVLWSVALVVNPHLHIRRLWWCKYQRRDE